jgi:hypothetical protein
VARASAKKTYCRLTGERSFGDQGVTEVLLAQVNDAPIPLNPA